MTSLATSVVDRLFDIRFGIRTGGIVEVFVNADACHTSTATYRAIRYLVDRLDLRPEDVFVDVGCGLGRVLAVAAQIPCRRIYGIEAAPHIAERAVANMEQLRAKRTPVLIFPGFADAFDYRDISVAYFFNPFGPSTFAETLAKMRADRNGKPLRLCYYNPMPEHGQALEANGFQICETGRLNNMTFVFAKLS